MRTWDVMHSFPASGAILWLASWFVPGKKRTEWLAEWRSELWHVCQICHQRRNEHEVTSFCLGAFKDALWMRRQHIQNTSRRVCNAGSPLRCEFTLAALATASLLVAVALPGVRKILAPSPYLESDDLVMISPSGNSSAPAPTVQLADYEDWSHSAHHLFTEFAFYQPRQGSAHFANHLSAELSIARASSNLLELLNIPTTTGKANVPSEHPAELILSRAVWNRYFHRDPAVFGRTVEIAGEQAVIAGVASENDWRLPGHVDVWLLESKQRLSALPEHTKGYVLGRIVPAAFPSETGDRRRMSVFRGGSNYENFDCISLAEQARQPLSIFLFTLLLACLALPATTSLPLGEYPATGHRLSWTTRFRRWLFLATKIGWIVAIVYCGSLDLAYGNASIGIVGSQYIQLVSSFSALLFAFRWALRDQRQRCPVCLRALTNPARVGQASQNFLAWNGTELICVGGHGLLHVPDIPTSWFSTQRWLYLDPSWSGLFSGGYLISPGLG
jgi:hypothetical protein